MCTGAGFGILTSGGPAGKGHQKETLNSKGQSRNHDQDIVNTLHRKTRSCRPVKQIERQEGVCQLLLHDVL